MRPLPNVSFALDERSDALLVSTQYGYEVTMTNGH